MKAIEPNPVNISIAVLYCFFGVMSFFVLKIAVKYFMKREKSQVSGKNQMEGKKMSKKYLESVNFSKVFLKTYFMKNTLIGSILSHDKKYLLKQIFVLCCIAISCFNINIYIMWPWSIGLGMSIITLAISQIMIPLIKKPKQKIPLSDNSQIGSSLSDGAVMGSIEIEINTRVEMIVSGQREDMMDKRTDQNLEGQKKQKSPNLEMFFIIVLAFVSEVLICACIVKLSMSVSNSGILNLISFGIGVLIDQVGARIGMGLLSYTVFFCLYKTKTVNLLENRIFSSCCSQAIIQDMRRVHEQVQIQAQNNKISNDNNLPSKNLSDTGAKMIHENCFEYNEEKVEDDLSNEVNPSDQAVLEEPDQEEEQEEQEHECKVEAEIKFEIESVEQKTSDPEILKDETNYLELFPHDIETFTEQIATTNRSVDKPKKIKKRVNKPEEKIKSDPLLYLPFEEHKLSSHRNSVRQELKSLENQMSLFEKERTSIDGNLLKNIEVLECVDDSIVTEEEAEIGTILNEKNLNIKTLTMNEKAQIPPTSRPTDSATKRSFSKDSVGVKKVKKVSPYLVDLQSEAIKPKKSKKTQKLMVSKINKENANQTNQSFMPDTIGMSGMTQKEFRTIDFRNTNNQNFARK